MSNSASVELSFCTGGTDVVSGTMFYLVLAQVVLLYANILLNAAGVVFKNKVIQFLALVPLGLAGMVGFVAFGVWIAS